MDSQAQLQNCTTAQYASAGVQVHCPLCVTMRKSKRDHQATDSFYAWLRYWRLAKLARNIQTPVLMERVKVNKNTRRAGKPNKQTQSQDRTTQRKLSIARRTERATVPLTRKIAYDENRRDIANLPIPRKKKDTEPGFLQRMKYRDRKRQKQRLVLRNVYYRRERERQQIQREDSRSKKVREHVNQKRSLARKKEEKLKQARKRTRQREQALLLQKYRQSSALWHRGIRPWKKYVQSQREQREKAETFSRHTILSSAYRKLRLQVRLNIHRRSKQRLWRCWKHYHVSCGTTSRYLARVKPRLLLSYTLFEISTLSRQRTEWIRRLKRIYDQTLLQRFLARWNEATKAIQIENQEAAEKLTMLREINEWLRCCDDQQTY